jgi:hypothetical protein
MMKGEYYIYTYVYIYTIKKVVPQAGEALFPIADLYANPQMDVASNKDI